MIEDLIIDSLDLVKDIIRQGYPPGSPEHKLAIGMLAGTLGWLKDKEPPAEPPK